MKIEQTNRKIYHSYGLEELILQMAVLPKAVYRFNEIPVKLDFPDGSDGKSICLQCRRPEFNPWVGKIPWRRKWQPTPVFLPGKSHGWWSLVGYCPWGRKEPDTTEQLHFTSVKLTMGFFTDLGK